ncbi:MAG: peptide methionine sulfoxide reductase [Flavobacteriaceae bacterium]|nr:peptide methionine sulfoxide reductase [Flavobacteriaceae bacterium]
MSTLHLKQSKIALGGGCHWCTEAVFQSLRGVEKVEQGYVTSVGNATTFSEAVVVHFNPQKISLAVLIEIHLYTHKSTVAHSMREKYRSAVYTFSEAQKEASEIILQKLQDNFSEKLVTQVLSFKSFKGSREAITNYYQKNPHKPFCERFIEPKLELLRKEFSDFTNKITP